MQWIYWLIAIVLSAGAGYWVYGTDKRRAVPFPWVTSILRSLVVFFTLLLVLVPTIVITKNVVEKPIVLLLQDDSRSVAVALGNDSANYRKNTEALTNRLSEQYKVVKWGFGNTVQSDTLFRYKQSATDISAALSRAQEFFGMQNLGAVILASDGRFNEGINPLYQQLSLHSSLYTVALGDSARQKDIRISRTYANKVVTINSSFEIRADIVAELCKGYDNTVTIKEDGNMLSSVPVSVNNDKYDRAVSFTIKAGRAGLHHYIITIPETGGEKNTTNNRKDIFVDVVAEKKNILIASAAPHPDVNAIKDALSGIESYKVTVCTADNFPASLNGYDVIILHGLPSVRNNIAPQLLAAKKPVWLILSSQSGFSAINSMQQLTHTNIPAAMPHDALAVYNVAFNAFTLPQQIQAVTDKMPPLSVSSGTIQLAPGANALFMQRSGAVQTSLWVLQQGSVPAAILLGEGLWRWRLYEYKNFNDHNVIDECIRQTVAFLATNNNEKPFSVVLPKYVWSDQEAISMNAYMLNANNEQVNTPDVQLTISDSIGHKQNFSFERSGSAYNLNIGIWAGGAYTYSAHTTFNDKTYTANGSFVVESMPLELMESGADYPLLYSLAKKYNGGFVTAGNVASLYDSIIHNEHIKPLIQANNETVPLVDRKWYFFLILLIAVCEWLLRKYWLAQ
ncbi:MAG: hypothetical protein ACHQD8_06060 [Chitinophagales bacterium]